jgi:hypothetical protein
MTQLAMPETKSQIISTFQQILRDRQNVASKVATKEEESEREKRKQVLEQAVTYTVDSIVKGLADLQLDFSGIVAELSQKLEAESEKLEKIRRGIAIASQQSQELQKIRVVADVLHILTQEHREKLNLLEQNSGRRQETLEKDIASRRKDWEKEQQEFELLVQEENENTAKIRREEEEDYNYHLQRSRQIEMDEYEEEKRSLEREIRDLTQEKEKDWQDRENVLDAEQAQFERDRQRVAGFEEELKQAFNKAKEDAIQEATREAKVKADLFAKEWESTKQGYELQVESLEQTIQRQNEQIADLSAQLQGTLKQAQELAMRAFSRSSNQN